MKKTYRLKTDVASSLRELFNGRAVEKAEEEWNNNPHRVSSLGVHSLRINLVRIHCEYDDAVTFTENDFEEVVEYDPDGWNTYPETKPTKDEEGEWFICRCKGNHPETAKPYEPILCRYFEGNFWDSDAKYEVDDDIGAFEFNASEPFIFRKVNFPKES